MLLVLGFGWTGARIVTWESPFEIVAAAEQPKAQFAARSRSAGIGTNPAPEIARPSRDAGDYRSMASGLATRSSGGNRLASKRRGELASRLHSASAGLKSPLGPNTASTLSDPQGQVQNNVGGLQNTSPFAPAFVPGPPDAREASGRWSLDAWAFWRQGSNAAPVSQGRMPIYGASQVGGVLRYALSPSSNTRPELYARAYRAMVTQGESELAIGASARPIAALPLRVAAEMRVTDSPYRTEVRPAAMVVTEIAPQRLPAQFRLEAYGGAGYVGGANATAFADGQVAVTRELLRVGDDREGAPKVSLGVAAWGGAQRDASRIDVGPTARIDFEIAKVPARVSIDWRERVGGDAAPASGIAASLSARF